VNVSNAAEGGLRKPTARTDRDQKKKPPPPQGKREGDSTGDLKKGEKNKGKKMSSAGGGKPSLQKKEKRS